MGDAALVRGHWYLEGVAFIRKLKSCAPFAETSPMLNDISHLAAWEKVHQGLIKLYQGEVLNKLQVVQHTLFGRLFPFVSSTGNTETRPIIGAGGVMAGMPAPRPGMGPDMGMGPGGPHSAAAMACMAAPWAKAGGRGAVPGVSVGMGQNVFTRVHSSMPAAAAPGAGETQQHEARPESS
jgi:hypothetical protein